MKFKSTLFSDVKTLTSTLRVRPSRDRTLAAHKKDSPSIFSSKISRVNARITTWRVSPVNWSNVASFLTAKNPKVGYPSSDSVPALRCAEHRPD